MTYAKFEMIPDALDSVYEFIEENSDNNEFNIELADYNTEREYRNEKSLDDSLSLLRDIYNEKKDELKDEIILGLKESPEARRQTDISNTLKLSKYEGSASNVLRDILLTSNTILQDIKNKKVELQDTIRQDERLVSTIKEDNRLIINYMYELENMKEIEKNYEEPFIKAGDNIIYISKFINEL